MLYSRGMASAAHSVPTGFARIYTWPRVRFTLALSLSLGVITGLSNGVPLIVDLLRASFVGAGVLFVFGAFETRPRRLPAWLPRTVLRLLAIVFVVLFCAAFMAMLDPEGRDGLGRLVGTALLFAPWVAVAAILRHRDLLVREQAFAFELERSEFERRVSDARLSLMQAQVEPHFLFNTLANIQALVDSGSPQASKVLSSLIAYLRAAVPRMQSRATTLDDEVQLVRAYLELMQMRMPDRLQYAIHVDPAAARLYCPPMTLLTLTENAVRHGIDPSETGGRIDADVWLRDNRCMLRVKDTGVGLKTVSRGLGTGLSTLRERLKLAFGGDAELTLTEVVPHGVCAEISFPGREAAA
jgi:hypothetical protein